MNELERLEKALALAKETLEFYANTDYGPDLVRDAGMRAEAALTTIEEIEANVEEYPLHDPFYA